MKCQQVITTTLKKCGECHKQPEYTTDQNNSDTIHNTHYSCHISKNQFKSDKICMYKSISILQTIYYRHFFSFQLLKLSLLQSDIDMALL